MDPTRPLPFPGLIPLRLARVVLALAAPALLPGRATADGPATPPAAVNTAADPAPRIERDFYDWYGRHGAVLALQRVLDPEIVLIGDSITHMWGGEPQASIRNGPQAWRDTFGGRAVLNMGFGWDRTQNVLWRLDHGEMDGLRPRLVVLNIGTNNFTATPNAHANSPGEIAEAIGLVCGRIQALAPGSRIIVMGVFPRGYAADDPHRAPIRALNALLASSLAGRPGVTFLDIGPRMLGPDGSMPPGMFVDGTHPAERGYQVWGHALLAAGL
jgi:lysophospholipase L1-like esterase